MMMVSEDEPDEEDAHQKGEVAASCMVAPHQSLPLFLQPYVLTIFSQLTFGNGKSLILILMVDVADYPALFDIYG